MALPASAWTYFSGDTPDTIKARFLQEMSDLGYGIEEGSLFDQIATVDADMLYGVGVIGVAALVQNTFLATMIDPLLDESDEAQRNPRKPAAFAVTTLDLTVTPGTTIAAGARFKTPAVGNQTAQVFATDSTRSDGGTGVIAGIPVTAVSPGAAGNVAAGTILFQDAPIPGVLTVTNPARATGGADREPGSLFRARLLEAAAADNGMLNDDQYALAIRALPGVGLVTIDPHWAGVDTIRAIILRDDGSIPDSTFVAAIQALVDPGISGLGHGVAAPGDFVTVVAPTPLTVNITIPSLLVEQSGTVIGTEASILANQQALFSTYKPGDQVILRDIEVQVGLADDVHDFGDILLNGFHTSITPTITQIPVLGSLTYSPDPLIWVP